MQRFATLDIGTNTVLLLVAQAENHRFVPVVERAQITRLGRGVDRTKSLAPEAIDDTVSAVVGMAREARSLGAESMVCVATSAARDAINGQVFLERVEREAGLSVQIITGDLEAQLAFRAARRDMDDASALVVLDIGGGSTEFVFGDHGQVSFQRSFNLGSVRLTERLVAHDPPSTTERQAMSRLLDDAFGELPAPKPNFKLVGIAGTVTTVCAVARAIDPYDAQRVHLARLSREEVGAQCDRYFGLDLNQRRGLPGMHPQRADVICAGALILERAMARLSAPEVVVSDRGIRWGLLYHYFGHLLA